MREGMQYLTPSFLFGIAFTVLFQRTGSLLHSRWRSLLSNNDIHDHHFNAVTVETKSFESNADDLQGYKLSDGTVIAIDISAFSSDSSQKDEEATKILDAYENSLSLYNKLRECKDSFLAKQLNQALNILTDALRLYGPHQLFSSYNGGNTLLFMHSEFATFLPIC